MVKIKKNGEVFTPKNIVIDMLDMIEYNGSNILNKHIIDNSAGDGAFLIEVVKRYINEYKFENKNFDNLKEDLEKYIHGIELDNNNYDELIKNLNDVVKKTTGEDILVNWDILNGNALYIKKYDGKIDFVVGNPPYVRIHNISSEDKNTLKKMKLTMNGMSDLYIAFYEIGINMLNDDGVMIYINPNSLYNSKAAKDLRRYLIDEKLLKSVINFGHKQVFDNITTYATIVILDKKNTNELVEFRNADINKEDIRIPEINSLNLSYSDIYINDNFYFKEPKSLREFNKILATDDRNPHVEVKNGFATLADSIFISNNFEYGKNKIKLIKSSSGEWKEAIFPYDENGSLLPFEKLDKSIQDYLKNNKEDLLKRSISSKENWYAFGRTQGLKDINKEKISINVIMRTKDDLKIHKVKKGEGVYSGLYIVSDQFSFDNIVGVLKTDEFENYVGLLGKYKNGGYYTFSSSDLRRYLIYKLGSSDNVSE